MPPQFVFPPKPTSSGVKPPHEMFYRIAEINPNYVAEIKKNGWASVIVKIGDSFTYYTRNKTLLDLSIIPEAKEELERLDLPHTVILGGEAIGRRTKSVKDILYLYGVYYANGKWLNDISLEENRKILKEIVKPTKRIEIAEYFTEAQCPGGRFDNFFNEVIKDEEVEGIILKDLTKPVKTDFRNSIDLKWWVKFKVKDDHKK